MHGQNDEDEDEPDDENNITVSTTAAFRSRPTFGSLESQFEDRPHDHDQPMLSD